MKPRLLDLFSGAGGAAVGYHRAGFEVVGVDIEPQPDYPFEFIRQDALVAMRILGRAEKIGPYWLNDFDAVHASPPCQDYSALAGFTTLSYPRLIEPVRELLQATGLPYVIENVERARANLIEPVTLCGSSFGLGVWRHRLFECSFPVMVPSCWHANCPEPIDVTGTGGPSSKPRESGGGLSRKPKNLAHAREVMGIDWMTRPELSESIPPAYTEHIGGYLMAHLAAERAAA